MTAYAIRRWLVVFKHHPSALLLAIQLLGVLLYPAMEDTQAGRAMFGAFGILVLSIALWVVNRSPLLNWVAWLLAVPAVVISIFGALSGRTDLVALVHLLEGALYLYTAFGLIAYMLRDHKVSLDELFAAGATFTLLAWAFAFSYSVCQQWYPQSFIAAVHADQPRSWVELLFLSFSTLSGVGLSDIIPIRPQARALVMLEQFTGVMYIALVVSRLIGLATVRVNAHGARADRDSSS